MDARQLAAFRAACETGSMAKAAEEVVITPQGLSRLVCSLEAELGGQLFVRTSQGVVPAELVGFAEMYTGIVRVRAEGLVALTTDFVVPPGSDDGLAVLPFRDKQFTWDEYIVVPRGSEVPCGVAKLWDFLPAWYVRHEREIFPWRGEDGPWPLMGARRAG